VRAEATGTSFGRLGPVTFSSGIVEWRREESSEIFDARARMAVARSAAHPPGRPATEADESLGEPRAR
jgi:hypothetical protein